MSNDIENLQTSVDTISNEIQSIKEENSKNVENISNINSNLGKLTELGGVSAEISKINETLQTLDLKYFEDKLNAFSMLLSSQATSTQIEKGFSDINGKFEAIKYSLQQTTDNPQLTQQILGYVREIQNTMSDFSSNSKTDIEDFKQAMIAFNETLNTIFNENSSKMSETFNETSAIKMEILDIKDSLENLTVKNIDTIQEKFDNVFVELSKFEKSLSDGNTENLKENLGQIEDLFNNTIQELLNKQSDSYSSSINQLIATLSDRTDLLRNEFGLVSTDVLNNVSSQGTKISQGIENLNNDMKSLFEISIASNQENLKNALQDYMNSIASLLSENKSGDNQNIALSLNEITDNINKILSNVSVENNKISNEIIEILNHISEISGLSASTNNNISEIKDSLTQRETRFFDYIDIKIKDFKSDIINITEAQTSDLTDSINITSNKIQELVTQKTDSLSEKIAQLDGELLAENISQFEQKMESYLENLKNIENLNKEEILADLKNILQKLQNSSYTDLSSVLENINSLKEDLISKISQNSNTIGIDTTSELKNELNNIINENLSILLQEINTNTRNLITEYKEETKEFIKNTGDEHYTSLANITTKINNSLNEIKNNLMNSIVKTVQDYDGTNKSSEEIQTNVAEIINEKISNLPNDISSVLENILNLRQMETREFIKSNNDINYDKMVNLATSITDEFGSNLNNLKTYLVNNMLEKLTNSELSEKHIELLNKNLTDKLAEKFNVLSNDFGNSIGNLLLGSQNELKNYIKANTDFNYEKINTMTTDIADSLNGLKDDIISKITDSMQSTNESTLETTQKIEKQVSDILSGKIEILTKDLSIFTEHLLNDNKNVIFDYIKTLDETNYNKLVNLSENISETVYSNIKEIQSELLININDNKQFALDTNEAIQGLQNTVLSFVSEKLDKLSEDINSSVQSLYGSSEVIENINKNTEQLENISSKLDKMKEDISQNLVELAQRKNDFSEDTLKNLELNILNIVSDKMSNLSLDAENISKNLIERYQNETRDFVNSSSDKNYERLSEFSTNANEQLYNLVNDNLSKLQKTLLENIKKIKPANNDVNLSANLEQDIKDIISNSLQTFKEKAEDFESLDGFKNTVQEQTEELKADILAEFNSRFKDFEEIFTSQNSLVKFSTEIKYLITEMEDKFVETNVNSTMEISKVLFSLLNEISGLNVSDVKSEDGDVKVVSKNQDVVDFGNMVLDAKEEIKRILAVQHPLIKKIDDLSRKDDLELLKNDVLDVLQSYNKKLENLLASSKETNSKSTLQAITKNIDKTLEAFGKDLVSSVINAGKNINFDKEKAEIEKVIVNNSEEIKQLSGEHAEIISEQINEKTNEIIENTIKNKNAILSELKEAFIKKINEQLNESNAELSRIYSDGYNSAIEKIDELSQNFVDRFSSVETLNEILGEQSDKLSINFENLKADVADIVKHSFTNEFDEKFQTIKDNLFSGIQKEFLREFNQQISMSTEELNSNYNAIYNSSIEKFDSLAKDVTEKLTTVDALHDLVGNGFDIQTQNIEELKNIIYKQIKSNFKQEFDEKYNIIKNEVLDELKNNFVNEVSLQISEATEKTNNLYRDNYNSTIEKFDSVAENFTNKISEVDSTLSNQSDNISQNLELFKSEVSDLLKSAMKENLDEKYTLAKDEILSEMKEMFADEVNTHVLRSTEKLNEVYNNNYGYAIEKIDNLSKSLSNKFSSVENLNELLNAETENRNHSFDDLKTGITEVINKVFKEDFDERYNSAKEEILNEIKTSFINEVNNTISVSTEKLNENYANNYNNASEKIDEFVQNISEKFSSIDLLRDVIDDKTKDFSQNIENLKFEVLDVMKTAFREEFYDKYNSLKNETEQDLLQFTKNAENALDSTLDKLNTKIQNDVVNKITDFQEKTNSYLNESGQILISDIDGIRDRINAEFFELKKNRNIITEENNKFITSKFNDVLSNLSDLNSSIDTKRQETKEDILSKINEILSSNEELKTLSETNLIEIKENLSSKVEEFISELIDVKNSSNSTIIELKENIFSKINEVISHIISYQTTNDIKTQETVETIVSRIGELLTSINNTQKNTENNLQENQQVLTSKLDTILSNNNEKEQVLTSFISEVKEVIIEKIEDVISNTTNIHINSDNNLQNVQENIINKIETITPEVLSTQTTIQENLSEIKNAIFAKMDEMISNADNAMSVYLNKNENTKTSLTELQTKIYEYVLDKIPQLQTSEKAEEQAKALKDELYKLSHDFVDSISSVDSLNNSINDLLVTLNSNISDIKSDFVDIAKISFNEAFEDKYTILEKYIQNNLSDLKEMSENSINKIGIELNNKLQKDVVQAIIDFQNQTEVSIGQNNLKVMSSLDEAKNEINSKISELQTEIDTNFEERQDSINTGFNELNSIIEKTNVDLETHIDTKKDELEHKLSEISAGTELVKADIINSINELKDNTNYNLEEHQNVENTNFNNLSEVMQESFSDVKSHISSQNEEIKEKLLGSKKLLAENIEQIRNISSNSDSKVNDIWEFLLNKVEDLNEIKAELSQIPKESEFNIVEFENLLSRDIENLKEFIETSPQKQMELEEINNLFMVKLNELRERLEDSIQEIVNKDFERQVKLIDIQKIVENNVSSNTHTIRNILENEVETKLDEVQSNLNTLPSIDSTCSKINSVVDEIKEQLNSQKELETTLQTSVENVHEIVENNIKNTFDEINSNIEATKKHLETQKETENVINEGIDNLHNILEHSIKTKLDNINSNLNNVSVINNACTEINNGVTEVKKYIDNQSKLEKTINTGFDNVYDLIENTVENHLEGIKSDLGKVTGIDYTCSDINNNMIDVKERLDGLDYATDKVDNKCVDIKDEIKSLKERISQLKESLSKKGEIEDYPYTFEDIETDIAKVRMILNEISEKKSFAHVEGLDKIEDDLVSLSSRTNKILLNSDETSKFIQASIDDLKNAVSIFSNKINNFDTQAFADAIENRLNEISNVVYSNAMSNKKLTEAFTYLAEWIDKTDERLYSLEQKASDISYIKQNMIKKSDLEGIFEKVAKKMEKQQDKIKTLEEKLKTVSKKGPSIKSLVKEVLSTVPDTDTKLAKKVDGIDRQLATLGRSIEKITSYVD